MISSVVKAVVIWAITQAIQDVLRTRAKSNALPAYLFVVAWFRPSLALLVVVTLVGSIIAGRFYALIWGNSHEWR